jgi:hypothetical protein
MPDETRHNPFYFTHKALRFGHCRMLAALGMHDFTDDRPSADLLETLAQLIALSRFDLEAEKTVLLPALAARKPGAAAEQEREQSCHMAALAELESLIRAVNVATAQRRNIAGRALYRCYALFAAADMARMDSEETCLLATLHQAFADDELRGLEGRLLAHLPEEELGTCLQLMMPALNAPERLAFLERLAQMVAPDTYSALLEQVVRPLLVTIDSAAA